MLMALCIPHQELHRLHAKSVWLGTEAMVVSFDFSFTVHKLLMMGDLTILDIFNVLTSSYFSFGGQFYEQTDKQ